MTAASAKKRGPGSAEPESSRLGQQLSSKHRQGSRLPDIELIHSLQHTDRDIFYSTYWEDHCLPALHPIFRPVSELMGLPAVRDAILALSSCNLGRVNAERKHSKSTAVVGTFSPSLSHLTRSQLYYSSAIKRFISFTPDDYRNSAVQVLTILVIFGYIEAAMGNFDGYYRHVQGMSAFLVGLHDATGHALFRALLTAWLQSQFLVRWARTYFSSLDVHQRLASIPFPADLEGTCSSLYDRRAVALSILVSPID